MNGFIEILMIISIQSQFFFNFLYEVQLGYETKVGLDSQVRLESESQAVGQRSTDCFTTRFEKHQRFFNVKMLGLQHNDV